MFEILSRSGHGGQCLVGSFEKRDSKAVHPPESAGKGQISFTLSMDMGDFTKDARKALSASSFCPFLT